MALKSVYDNLTDVPAALTEFYTERDGKFHLGVEGLVPKARVDEFRDTNISTRRELDELRARFEGVDPDVFRTLSEQAKKIADKKLLDAGKVDELIEARVAAMRADHDKAIGMANGEAGSLRKQLESLVIDGGLRDAAMKAGVRPTAVEDALLRGRGTFRLVDGKSVAFDGDRAVYGKSGDPLGADEWMAGMAERAPHWFEASTGGGSNKASASRDTGAKTMTRTLFDTLPPAEQSATVRGGTQIVD